MKLKLNWSSKLSLAILLLFTVFIGNLRYQQYKNQRAVDREKKDLENQIASFSKKNQDLSDSLSYLNSSDFKERAARQQLNLKREGEVVFGFTDAPAQTSPLDRSEQNKAPNYEKWVEYFFGNN